MQAHVPYWMVVLIGVMYRFVVGGFGISLPHPYKAKICPRFWLVALPGCTLGLPIVLLGWAIRLTLGKGRAERFFDWLEDVLSTPQAKVLGKVLLWVMTIAAIGAVLFGIGYFIYKYGWWQVTWRILVVAGGVVAVIGLLVCITLVSDKLRAWNATRPKREKKPVENKKEKLSLRVLASKNFWAVPKTILIVVTWLPRMMLIVWPWQVLEFVGLIFYAGYKKFCPAVEFP